MKLKALALTRLKNNEDIMNIKSISYDKKYPTIVNNTATKVELIGNLKTP